MRKLSTYKKEDPQTQCLKVLGLRWCHSLVWIKLLSHFCLISPVFPPSDSPSKWYESRWFVMWRTLTWGRDCWIFKCESKSHIE